MPARVSVALSFACCRAPSVRETRSLNVAGRRSLAAKNAFDGWPFEKPPARHVNDSSLSFQYASFSVILQRRYQKCPTRISGRGRGGTAPSGGSGERPAQRRDTYSGGGGNMSLFNTSYLMGNDTVGGWGPRYFFTFYAEFGDETAESAVEVTVLMVIFAASVAANSSIAWAVLRYREMRTVTNCFLLNLTVADLLFAVTTPALAYVRVEHDWPYGDFVCRALPYSQFVCGFVLLWTLTLISMDRHRCIVVPPYRSRLTPRRAAVLTAFTWLIALAVFMPVPFWFHEQSVQNGTINICTLVFPKNDTFRMSIVFTVSVVSLSCVLPLSLFVYHYQRIFHKLNKTRRRIEQSSSYRTKAVSQSSLSPPSNGAMPQVLVRHEEVRYRKHVRVVRVLLINVIVVLVMWLPITVVMCLIYVDGSRDTEDTGFFLRSHHFIMGLLFALLNTVVNPILYGVLSENFRKCFARLWFISKRRRAANRELLDNMSRGGNRTPSYGLCNSVPQQPGSSASVVELPVAAGFASSSGTNECW